MADVVRQEHRAVAKASRALLGVLPMSQRDDWAAQFPPGAPIKVTRIVPEWTKVLEVQEWCSGFLLATANSAQYVLDYGSYFFELPDVPVPLVKTCECGATKCGSAFHSSWCVAR